MKCSIYRNHSTDFEEEKRYSGHLKYFNELNNFGFLIVDGCTSDVFVHFDDLRKEGLTKEELLRYRSDMMFFFSFRVLNYVGKNGPA